MKKIGFTILVFMWSILAYSNKPLLITKVSNIPLDIVKGDTIIISYTRFDFDVMMANTIYYDTCEVEYIQHKQRIKGKVKSIYNYIVYSNIDMDSFYGYDITKFGTNISYPIYIDFVNYPKDYITIK